MLPPDPAASKPSVRTRSSTTSASMRLRRPDLAAPHRPAAGTIGYGAGGDAARVGAGVGLGDAEGHVEVTPGGARQEGLLQLLVAELHDRVQPEHREVQGRRAVHRRPRCRDAVEHQRRLGDALTAAPVLLGDGDADPAALGHGPVELPREAVLLVAASTSTCRRSRGTHGRRPRRSRDGAPGARSPRQCSSGPARQGVGVTGSVPMLARRGPSSRRRRVRVEEDGSRGPGWLTGRCSTFTVCSRPRGCSTRPRPTMWLEPTSRSCGGGSIRSRCRASPARSRRRSSGSRTRSTT